MDPSLHQLLRMQRHAKWRRFVRAISRRRRWGLTLLAALLTCFWLGNMVLSAIFRTRADLHVLEATLPAGMLGYAAWHVLKAALNRPLESIEWSPAEQEWVAAGPFPLRDLLFYRLSAIANAVLLKSACFTLLLLPDLHHPLSGWVGIILSLFCLDLWRLGSEIIAHGMSHGAYRWFRLVVLTIATTLIACTLAVAVTIPYHPSTSDKMATWSVLRHLLSSGAVLLDTPAGHVALWPFTQLARLLLESPRAFQWWLSLAFALATLAVFLRAVLWIGSTMTHWSHLRERQEYSPERTSENESDRSSRTEPFARRPILWLSGIGPLVWRQALGARRQGGQLAIAMAVPGVLAMLPIVVVKDPTAVAIQTAAALAFYSFLLLPTALKFDFRRDLNRMAILKTLPIRPVALVIGQISTPAWLAFGLQALVLAVTCLLRPYSPTLLVGTLLVLLPLNFLVFAVDNLLYLLFPYRLNQEGMELFLRTTLTFTAKGLIFAVGMALTLVWSFVAHHVARQVPGVDPAIVFLIGGCVLLWTSVTTATILLARAFHRFDPAQDIPA